MFKADPQKKLKKPPGQNSHECELQNIIRSELEKHSPSYEPTLPKQLYSNNLKSPARNSSTAWKL